MGFLKTGNKVDSGCSVTEKAEGGLRLKSPFALLISCVVVSACVGTDPTLGLSSDQSAQPLDTSGEITLTDNTLIDGNQELVETGDVQESPTVVDGIGIPTQSPNNSIVSSDNVRPVSPTQELAVVDSTENTPPTGNVIEGAVNETTQIIQGENQASSTETESSLQDSNTVQEPQEPKPQANFLAGLFPNKPNSVGIADGRSSFRRTTNRSNSRDEDGGIRVVSAHSTAKTREVTTSKRRSILLSRARVARSGSDSLPGVRSNDELFGINKRDNGGASSSTQLASVGGLGILSPNGLRVQHEKVRVDCLKPGILRLLKVVERRYGSKPIITSGYRSPKGNRRAGGASNSMHIYCKAVDIQVEGVSKWELAKFLRSIPGRGGVGTYCRTKSVHLDTGSKRDWHHACRRSKVKKRKRA